MKKIGIAYSSFNNYAILENEVLGRVDFEGYPVINIDDHSEPAQQEHGARLCQKNDIHFAVNESKGLQHAVAQAIAYLQGQFHCDWVFCLQQDVFPASDRFFSAFESLVETRDTSDIAAIGFNVLDKDDSYTCGSYEEFKEHGAAKGAFGSFFLSDSRSDLVRMAPAMYAATRVLKAVGTRRLQDKARRYILSKRVFCERHFHGFRHYSTKYEGLFAIELPMWCGIAINANKWEECVRPSQDFIFHLWFNDVAMQFLSRNVHLAATTDLYLLNEQRIKEKYGFVGCSAAAGMRGRVDQVEEYGAHLTNFESRWGFSYEDPRTTYPAVRKRYRGTLVDAHFAHDCRHGPLRTF